MSCDKQFEYLIHLQDDLRDEIKQRISQRDKFATQFIVACGTIIGISFGNFPYAGFLIWLLPIVSIFYSMLILYSYIMHDRLTEFLRINVEPELAGLLNIPQNNLCWETYCYSKSNNNNEDKEK